MFENCCHSLYYIPRSAEEFTRWHWNISGISHDVGKTPVFTALPMQGGASAQAYRLCTHLLRVVSTVLRYCN